MLKFVDFLHLNEKMQKLSEIAFFCVPLQVVKRYTLFYIYRKSEKDDRYFGISRQESCLFHPGV